MTSAGARLGWERRRNRIMEQEEAAMRYDKLLLVLMEEQRIQGELAQQAEQEKNGQLSQIHGCIASMIQSLLHRLD